MTSINERVKEVRKQLNLSQEEFGKSIGLSKSGISNIENGTRNVNSKHVKLISMVFNIDEQWLLTGIKENISADFEEHLSNEVKTLELVQKHFGKNSIELLQQFDKLNSKGKEKAIRDIADMTEIPKYQK